MLQSATQTRTISSTCRIIVMGNVPLRIRYIFIPLIALSTWICKFAISFLFCISFLSLTFCHEDFLGDMSKWSATSSFNSTALMLKEVIMGFNDVGIIFLPVLFKTRMACLGPYQYVICGMYSLINVKISSLILYEWSSDVKKIADQL